METGVSFISKEFIHQQHLAIGHKVYMSLGLPNHSHNKYTKLGHEL